MRLVILGASNIANLLPAVVAVSRRLWRPPVEIAAACGHGRSYLQTSRFLVRHLPCIPECGLWEYLQKNPAGDHCGLVTDVGNDLLYGAHPAATLDSVDRCLHQLRSHCRRITVVGTPLATVQRMSMRRFYVFTRLLFPTTRLTYQRAQEGIRELDQGLRQLAQKHSAQWLEPDPSWYGSDPIHVRSAAAQHAARLMLGSLADDQAADVADRWSDILRAWHFVRTHRVERRKLFGYPQYTPQPCRRTAWGIELSLF